jgi:hypothetical protein
METLTYCILEALHVFFRSCKDAESEISKKLGSLARRQKTHFDCYAKLVETDRQIDRRPGIRKSTLNKVHCKHRLRGDTYQRCT